MSVNYLSLQSKAFLPISNCDECKPGAQSYLRSDTLVLSHASLDSYKYQYRSNRIFLEYAHLLYTDCYLHPEEYTMVLTSCDRAQ